VFIPGISSGSSLSNVLASVTAMAVQENKTSSDAFSEILIVKPASLTLAIPKLSAL
jgi:hypothetical protein